MRKLAAALFAVPVLAALYVPVVLRRSVAARIGLALGVGAILGIAAIGIARPSPIAARPPTVVAPLSQAALVGRVETGHQLKGAVTVSFAQAMDAASVAAALRISPATAVDLSWNASGTVLAIAPRDHWAPATYYLVTVGGDALAADGGALGIPARALFTTRPMTNAWIAFAVAGDNAVATDGGFTVTFNRPVDLARAVAAFRIAPAVAGRFDTRGGQDGGSAINFLPNGSLSPGTAYTVSLEGDVPDADGVAIATPAPLAFTTRAAAAVVRFRPLNRTSGVAQGALLSVRFSRAMDRASTQAAFGAWNGHTRIAGKLSWAEGDTVLILDPAAALPYGATIQLRVEATARAADGTVVRGAASVRFTVEPKPIVAARTAGTTSGSAGVKIPTGGSSVGAGTWYAVETYYLKLMNCTRGGGWVTSAGVCSSPGGSGIAPLILSKGISDHVSRPYAQYLVARGICDHFADGTPGDRLRRAGYPGDYRENLGCEDIGNPYASVLGSHLFFQDEKPCGGYCHYANIMSTAMKYVGIGVWVSGARVRLVVDFWQG